MRKIKKINGYLVVKFNDRELREWADTGLGNFGVIDAELYTGCLEVDRSVMEYDSAGSIEEAVVQARGLESELDVNEPPTSYTVIKETDDREEITGVDPVIMVDEWEEALAYQIESKRYPEINPETARHELYGFMVALRELGIYDPDKCFVEPCHFEPTGTPPLDSDIVPIKVSDTAVTLEYLKRQRDMATHNLFCYSANYAMTKPKEGYEDEWRKAGQDCELVEELLQVISPSMEECAQKEEMPILQASQGWARRFVSHLGISVEGKKYSSQELARHIGQSVLVKVTPKTVFARMIDGKDIGELIPLVMEIPISDVSSEALKESFKKMISDSEHGQDHLLIIGE